MAEIPAAIERHTPLGEDCDSFLGCAACAWAEGHAAGVQAGREAAAADIGALIGTGMFLRHVVKLARGDDQESGATS